MDTQAEMIAEIVYWLDRYRKRDLELQDHIEHRAHNVESVRQERDYVLQELKKRIDSYIDDRIEKALNK